MLRTYPQPEGGLIWCCCVAGSLRWSLVVVVYMVRLACLFHRKVPAFRVEFCTSAPRRTRCTIMTTWALAVYGRRRRRHATECQLATLPWTCIRTTLDYFVGHDPILVNFTQPNQLSFWQCKLYYSTFQNVAFIKGQNLCPEWWE